VIYLEKIPRVEPEAVFSIAAEIRPGIG